MDCSRVVDDGREVHLGLVEDEQKAAMVSFSLAGGEAAGNLGNLGDEELDGDLCGLADHLVKFLVSKFFPHYLGDCCAGCC